MATSQELADKVRVAKDVSLPKMQYWNDQPCKKHVMWLDELGTAHEGRPKPGCKHCGVIPRKHQRVGISWLYLVRRGLLADTVGSGKTVHAAGLLALLKERGELHHSSRAVAVMRPAALMQFAAEMARMIPGVHVIVADGTRQQRINQYLAPWDVLLIGYHMLQKDLGLVDHFNVNTLIVDDVDALRNPDNRTAYCIKKLAIKASRVVIMTGTPLQKRIHEMHSVLEPIGGRAIFGSKTSFEKRYVRSEVGFVYNHKTGRKFRINKAVGYKNLDEFKRLIAPLALRRTAEDIDDVDLPSIISSTVELDLYPQQRAAYDDLRKGVLALIKDGKKVTQVNAMLKLHTGAKICAGLPALGEPDGEGRAVKLDWIESAIGPDGDLGEDKVVVFINYKDTIRALQKRLDKLGIGYATIWGDVPDKHVRAAEIARFWEDPKCRLLIGTTSIEQSLNLQCARHLINVDMILNPARMTQLAGRIRRDGSPFKSVYVHNLLCVDTQEDKYLPLLEMEQALIDHVWDENNELFERLSPLAMLQMIAG